MFECLKKSPFNLDDQAIAWVKQTFAQLSIREKIGQLLTVASFADELEEADSLLAIEPGGVCRMPSSDMLSARAMTDHYLKHSKVPLLIAGDFEGGLVSLAYGADYPSQLGLASADDVELTTRVATAMALEAKAMGYNWSFTPSIDINFNHRSAIVGTRSFGSDIATIESQSLATIDAWQQQGMASCVKHWPGDGIDDRDQHLVTSVNSLSMDEWRDTYGCLFQANIDAGVLTIMTGHIALPAYIREQQPEATLEAYRPASVSKLLNLKLLREEMGFNGLITSDATVMAGLGAWQNREVSAPEIIENGCDMFLFNESPERDMALIEQGLKQGVLTEHRLNEAVIRVLGLKAALGLHQDRGLSNQQSFPAIVQNPEHLKLSAEAAEQSVTLVKDVQSLLPLSPKKHKRVLVITEGIFHVMSSEAIPFKLTEQLASAGFEVKLLNECTEVSYQKTDLIVYLFGDESMMTRSHIYIDWMRLHNNLNEKADNSPDKALSRSLQRYWHDIPTIMISFGHPYYLYDAPRVPTYINAYSCTEASQTAVLKTLLGEIPFTAGNPVDPFCGLEDARY